MQSAINAAYFRQKVQTCLQLAKVLPWNDPVRYQLLLMAEDFQKRETEFEEASLVRERNAQPSPNNKMDSDKSD